MISCSTESIAPERMSGFNSSALSRMLDSDDGSALFALLDPEKPLVPSSSAFTDLERVAVCIGEANPDLPPPPQSAVYLIAGQQAGLLTGPLYTFLKAVSLITLTRELVARTGRVILPLFWVAAEDHDILEVNRVSITGQKFVVPPSAPLSRGRMPQVGDVSLSDSQAPLIEFLKERLPATPFSQGVIDQVAGADFTDYATAFQSLLAPLFAQWELRFITPQAVRSLTGPVLAAIVEVWPEVVDLIASGGSELARHQLTAPLTGARIYEIVDSLRIPLDITSTGVILSSGTKTLSEFAAEIRLRPHEFSPSAALRPLCQDGALPVVATVGGPSELLYLTQILPVYSSVKVTPSRRFPRISATFFNHTLQRQAGRADLQSDQLFSLPDRLKKPSEPDNVSALDNQVLRSINDSGAHLLSLIDQLQTTPSPRWLRSGRDSIARGLTRITNGYMQEQLTAAGQGRAQLAKLNRLLFPHGQLQERSLNIFQLLNQHGPEFVSSLIDLFDPFEFHHQLVSVSNQEEKHGD